MTQKSDMKDQSKEAQKEAQKQFDSYYTVAKHRLGREPTFEEVVDMMGENSSESVPTPVASQSEAAWGDDTPEQGTEELDKTGTEDEEMPCQAGEGAEMPPKILQLKIYFGLGAPNEETGEKAADPNKILFYEDPSTGACYDCNSDDWTDERPTVLDHLPSRPIEFNERDIVAAIAHGVMDEQSFDALDKAEMITDIPRSLWSKTQQLQKDLAELEKIESMEKSESMEEEPLDPDLTPEGHNEMAPVQNNVTDIMNSAGAESGVMEELAELHGDDVAAQIMATAMQIAMTNMEDQIRKIVREELGNYGSSSYEEETEDESEPIPLDDEVVFEEDEAPETVDTEETI